MPAARPGVRIEIIAIEPIILLSVTRKVAQVDRIDVTQPFYAVAWDEGNEGLAQSATPRMQMVKRWLSRIAPRYAKWRIALRDVFLIGGLALGLSPYSLKRRCAETIDVRKLLNERSKTEAMAE